MSQPRGSQLELTGPAAPAGEPPSSPLDAIPVDVVCSQEDAALFALADTPTRSRRAAAGRGGGRANSTPTRVPAASARGVDDEPPSSQPRLSQLDPDEIEHLRDLAAESFEADRRAGTDGVSISPARGIKRRSSGMPISSTGPSEGSAGGVRALTFATPPPSPLRPRGLNSRVGTLGVDDDIAAAEELTFEEAERRRREEAVRDGRHVDLTTETDPVGSPRRPPVIKREPGTPLGTPRRGETIFPVPESPGLRPGPGGRMLTKQQRVILQLAKAPNKIPFTTSLYDQKFGEIIRVTAAAGTGKTTTMMVLAEKLLELGHPKVTYVTFTREQKKDAEERFRRRFQEKGIDHNLIDVRTLHSLAGHLLGVGHDSVYRMNEGELERETLRLFQEKIDNFLREGGVDNAGYKVRRQRAFWIVKTMMTFLQNRLYENDAKAFEIYYPARLYYDGNGKDKKLEKKTAEQAADFYRERAKELWDALKVKLETGTSESGKSTHDVIQKQAYLEKCTVKDCHAILVDESQDLTDCQIAWMSLQRGSDERIRRQVFFVGDMAQTIYSFRGARSKYLIEVKADHDCELTQSFRFKYPIARVANTILFGKKHSPQAKDFRPYKVQSASRDTKCEVFHYGARVEPEVAILKLRERCALEQEQKDRMVTVVSLRNSTLIKTALALLQKSPDVKIAVCGDMQTVTSGRGRLDSVCKKIKAFHRLEQGETKALPREFKSFCDEDGNPMEFEGGWAGFKQEVLDRDLGEFNMYVDICDEFGVNTMVKVKELQDHVLNRNPEECDVLITTIHTAKGLEWTNVVVLDDLPQLAAFEIVNGDPAVKGSKVAQFAWKDYGDDFNCWYVAVTRAKRRLVVPRAIVDVYEAFNHAKNIVRDVDPDPWMDVNADYFLPPYGTNDQVDVEEDGRFHMYHEDAKSYKAKKNGAIIKQVFKLDEVKLINELGVMLWQDCDVREPPNVIEEV